MRISLGSYKTWKGFASLSLRFTAALLFAATSVSTLAVAKVSAQGAGRVNTANQSKDSTERQVLEGEVLVKLKASARPATPRNFGPESTGHESLNRLNREVGAQKFEALLSADSPGADIKSEFAGWYKVSLPNSGRALNEKRDEAAFKALQRVVDRYKGDPNVEFAQPSYVAQATATPNDPFFHSSYNFPGYEDLWGLRKINAEAAWNLTTGSTNVVVAVIDSGVNAGHPDLAANMWKNTDGSTGWNFLTNTNNPADDNGHGSMVAGVLGAVGNNGVGVVGVNWNTRIMALKFLDSRGNGSNTNAAKALQWAADRGAKVINNSYGCNCKDRMLQDAVGYAHNRGSFVVVAAGNGVRDAAGNFLGTVDALDNAPANADQAVTVGSTDYYDTKAYDSNTGPKLDVTAPGVNIISTKGGNMCNGDYCIASGTSFAAPHVSGIAALLLTRNGSLTNEQIRQTIRRNSHDLGSAGKDNSFGYGRIDANRALTPAYIGGVKSGRCLDVPGASRNNGVPITIWDCHGGENQQWTIDTSVPNSTGYYPIKVYGGTKCLDIANGAYATNGARIQLWDCHGGANQLWRYNHAGPGTLRSYSGDKCLDVINGATGNGSELQIWPCILSENNQRWNGSFGQAPASPYISNLRTGDTIYNSTTNKTITGTTGTNASFCKIETGVGRNPTSWRQAGGRCQIGTSNGNVLGTIDPFAHTYSLYTVRLTVTNYAGQTFEYEVHDVKIGP